MKDQNKGLSCDFYEVYGTPRMETFRNKSMWGRRCFDSFNNFEWLKNRNDN